MIATDQTQTRGYHVQISPLHQHLYIASVQYMYNVHVYMQVFPPFGYTEYICSANQKLVQQIVCTRIICCTSSHVYSMYLQCFSCISTSVLGNIRYQVYSGRERYTCS